MRTHDITEIRALIKSIEREAREKSIFKDKLSAVRTGGGTQLGYKYRAQSKGQRAYSFDRQVEFLLELNDIDLQQYKELKCLYESKASPSEKSKKYKEIATHRQQKQLEKQAQENYFNEQEFLQQIDSMPESIDELMALIQERIFISLVFKKESHYLIRRFFSKDLSAYSESQLQKFFILAQESNRKAVKEFGTNYAEFFRNGQGAIKKLLETKSGQVQGAFHRERLGDIALVYGDSSFGLLHILQNFTGDFAEVIESLPDIIEKGQLRQEEARVFIDSPSFVLEIQRKHNSLYLNSF